MLYYISASKRRLIVDLDQVISNITIYHTPIEYLRHSLMDNSESLFNKKTLKSLQTVNYIHNMIPDYKKISNELKVKIYE